MVQDCYTVSCIAYAKLEQFERAIELVNEMILCNPRRIQSFVIRSRLFEMEGHIDKAIEDLKTASHIDPENPIVAQSIKKLHHRNKGNISQIASMPVN